MRHVLSMLACALGGSLVVLAQPAPIPAYAASDRLPTETVASLLMDSRGFIWLGTRTGVSRFDGARFVSYGPEHGLPDPIINDVIEDRDGRIWAASNGGGVARFDPAAPAGVAGPDGGLFRRLAVGTEATTNRVNVLLQDATGRLWAGTDGGLFVTQTLEPPRFDAVPLDVPAASAERSRGIARMAFDRDGTLWLGSYGGLLARRPDGSVVSYANDVREQRPVHALLVDGQGRLWIGSDIGLFVLRPHIGQAAARNEGGAGFRLFRADACRQDREGQWQLPERAQAACQLPLGAIAADVNVRALLHTRSDSVVIATESGQMGEFVQGRLRAVVTRAERPSTTDIIEDRAGSLWTSSLIGGLARVARQGLVTYDVERPLAGARIRTFLGERDAALLLATGRFSVFQFADDRLTRMPVPLPPRLLPPQWSSELLDRSGNLWIGSGEGLFRVSLMDARQPRHFHTSPGRYGKQDGLSGDALGRLFEDSRGDLWIGAGSGPEPVISHWQRSTGRFTAFQSPFATPSLVTAFAEDTSGAIWAAFRDGGLARIRNGAVEAIAGTEQLVSGRLYVDRAGRLWATSLMGAIMFDSPMAARPIAKRFSTREGLSSNTVYCFAEDRRGRLYIGNAAGVDRLDVATGGVRHYGAADGLPPGDIVEAYAASDGQLWFTTSTTLARLTPDNQVASAPPPALINGVIIAGVPHPLAELGAAAAGTFDVASSHPRVQIAFSAIATDIIEPLRYQYRLQGLDPDWNPPTRDRSITYAGLAPGSYRFAVRAVSPEGQSGSEALVLFNVLPPFYRRAWFIVLLTLAGGTAIGSLHRYRLSHVLRLERVRQRIATDLHDDIGASLSQIAIVSDLGRSRLEQGDLAAAADRLSVIAATSRELVDTMSDIVWAVNPHRDSLDDLVHRMRRFAADTLEAANVSLTFAAPSPGAAARLGPDARREILLILKEIVTNIARHARCTEAEIEFHLLGHRLRLRIRDNGCGFDVDAGKLGNGLRSMRRRVERMSGHFHIDSTAGRGTEITLEIPIS